MKKLTLAIAAVVLVTAVGCGVQNSFSGDRRFQQVSPVAAGFGAVQGILQARCAECHDFPKLTEAKLKASSDLIKPGDPECSMLYFRLKGANAKCSALDALQNMPSEDKPALSAQEIGVIRDWIKGLAPKR